MKRRIFLNMILLTTISLVIAAAAMCFVYYAKLSNTVETELKNRAETFVDNTSDTAIEALTITKSSDMRVTVISADGTVIFDNTAEADTLPNHSDRQEVQQALESGYGQTERFSDTLDNKTLYYAVRLIDGNVLRVAKTTGSIFNMFTSAVPVVIVILVIMAAVSYIVASRLTRRIVRPIVQMNLDEELKAPYDELAPFVKTVARQREHIAGQLSDLEKRTDTISVMMDNLNEGIILLDAQGAIISANKSAMGIFGRSKVPQGRGILEVVRDVEFSRNARRALEGGSGEMTMERGARLYAIHFSSVTGGGAIILFWDITEREKSEKMRREFSANVSHELKTPLTSLYGSAELLESGMVEEEDRQQFYGRIKGEASRMIALIDDILMLSRLDEGGGREAFEPVYVLQAALEAAEALEPKANVHNVSINVKGSDVVMSASRPLIYELIYNLVDNAVKYNKDGGSVLVEVAKQEDKVAIKVSDTGIGIPEGERERVFERFYRVDKSRSKSSGGTGLGLAIVKHIVMVHDGELSLESRENEGTVIEARFRDMGFRYKTQ